MNAVASLLTFFVLIFSANDSVSAPMEAESSLEISSVKVEYNQVIRLRFNQELQTSYTPQQWVNLKASITISNDEGKSYHPLEDLDQVQIGLQDPSDFYWNTRTLSIKLFNKFPEEGVSIKLSAATPLQAVDGYTMVNDYISAKFSRGMSLELQSKPYLAAEEVIQFVADRVGTVLLTQYLPDDGTLEEYKVKSAAIVEVDKSRVGELIKISTDGLSPGNYRLLAWEGEEHPIGLSVTPHIRADQVIFDNSANGNDTITIANVQPGDKLYIYDDVYKPYEGWIKELFSTEIPSDHTSIDIQEFELDTSGQLVFLLKREGLLLSQASLIDYE
jgi:hypothetical protein